MESLHLHVTGPLTFRFLIPHHHHNHELLIDQLRRQLTTERTVLSEAAAFCPVSRTTILRHSFVTGAESVLTSDRIEPTSGHNRTLECGRTEWGATPSVRSPHGAVRLWNRSGASVHADSFRRASNAL